MDPNFKDNYNNNENHEKDGANTKGVKLDVQKANKNESKKKKKCC